MSTEYNNAQEQMHTEYRKSISKYPFFENYEPHKTESWIKRFGETLEDNDHFPKGTTIKIVMVSRFGDVGITNDLTKDYGSYNTRVPLYKIDSLREKI